VECPYKKIGCQAKFEKKIIEEHLTSSLITHNLLMLDEIIKLNERSNTSKESKVLESSNKNDKEFVDLADSIVLDGSIGKFNKYLIM
jgi:hypothetical protein